MKNFITSLFASLFFLLLNTSAFAQGEGNNWIFGNDAGLNFSTDPPTIISNPDFDILTYEGCASISNQAGELLFYTDGRTVWNSETDIMLNGDNLLGNKSATQSAVVVPNPGNPDLYYIFTVDALTNDLSNGFRYSLLNLTLDDGLGGIDADEKNILLIDQVPEKVTAVKHGNEPAYWVITHGWDGADANSFYVFKIDQNGLNTTPFIFPIGDNHEEDTFVGYNPSRGYLKASPDGTLLASARGGGIVDYFELFDFNDLTGEISNRRTVGSNFSDPYGIEFSPDGTKMYLTSLVPARLVQIDLANSNQETILPFNASDGRFAGALQISPYGIIYMATGINDDFGGQPDLPAILDPDIAGLGCNFVDRYQSLGTGRVHYGLPTFIQSFFIIPSFRFENTCFNDETEFFLEIELEDGQEIDNVIWDFGDPASGANNTITVDTEPYGATHVFTDVGSYTVTITVELVGGFTFTNNSNVTINPIPEYNIGNLASEIQDTFRICQGESIIFRIVPWTFSNAIWNNNSAGQISAGYNTTGDVIVNVINTQGCSARDTVFLEVRGDPDFVWKIPNFCNNDSPIIINDSIEPTGGVFSGNAVIFNDPNYILDPSLIPVGGSETVFYDYEDEIGCTSQSTLDVSRFELPDVDLTLSTDNYCEDAEAFTLNGGTPAGGDYLFNGSVVTEFDPQAEGPGSYEIKYSIVSGEGCSDTASAFIEVNALPEVTFDPIPALCQNTGTFTITQGSGLPAGGTGVYSGSPNIDADGNFNTNTAAGIYDLVYTYTDINGCADFAEQSVEVILEPQAPTAISVDINTYCSAQAPADITLACEGSDANYFWYENDFAGTSIGNTKTLTIAAPTVTTTYLTRSETSCGNSDALSITVTVNPSPTAAFSAADVCENVAVEFLNESLSPLDPITSWNWDFGDGNISEEESPTHTYSGFGIRDIELIVKTDALCPDTATQSITITQAPQPPTVISVNIDEYCISLRPDEITLACAGLDDDYFWYENDFAGLAIGSTKTLTITAPAVTTTYLARSETSCGNSDALSITVTVLPNPTAAFNAADVCDGNSVQFNDASFDNNDVITDWNWDFGDGNASTDQSPEHLFTGFGTQNTQLVVTNASGCVDTLQQTVEVFDNPVASFSFSTECLGDASNFISTSNAPASTINQWTWQMDGSTYTTETTSHIFSGSGDFTVNLTVETEQGCSDALSQTVEVYPLPVAAFTYFNPCRSNVVELTNNSTSAPGGGSSPISDYLWDFNNGVFSDKVDLIYIYPDAGLYSIALTVTDENECENTFIENNVQVSPDFDVSISAEPFCIGTEGTFDGEPVPDFLLMDQYEWILPDGSLVTGEDINYTFDAAGVYEVGLVGTLDICTAGKTYTLEVKELPTADFISAGQCLLSPIQFTDQSEGDGLSIVGWSWDFGDGAVSDVEAPQHTYTSTADFTISLGVTDANGCEESTTQNINIRPLPVSNFSAQQPRCEGNSINFTNSSSGPGALTGFLWNMGDGTSYTDETISHTYLVSGDQNISLTVTDDRNCTDTRVETLTVVPDFSLTINAINLCNDTDAELSGEVVSPALVPDTWGWLFEDGSTASGQTTVYNFGDFGDYLVQITAVKDGCVEVHNQSLSVKPSPTADFSNSFVSLDDIVLFSDESTLNGGAPLEFWSWNFDDPGSGTENTSELQNPEHLFTEARDFNVALLVTDENGCEGQTMKTITVNEKPVADFLQGLACDQSEVQFTDNSTTSVGNITNWWWDFDDPASGISNQSNAQNPTHLFSSAGVYNVQLIIKAFGFDTITKQVEVYEIPQTQFSWSLPCLNQEIQLTDNSSAGDGIINQWRWEISDGSSFSIQNPAYTFPSANDFDVKLVVKDDLGCSDSLIKNLRVLQHPTSNFEFTLNCLNTPTLFNNTSDQGSSPIAQYEWTFGDGNNSSDENPTNTYNIPGNYNVNLKLTNNDGCSDVTTQNISISDLPEVDFQILNSLCQFENVIFNDLSSGTIPIDTYEWNFGDGGSSTQQNPIHTYNINGDVRVSLEITDEIGCVNTTQQDYFVTPDFSLNIAAFNLCNNTTANLSGEVVDLPLSPDSWSWILPDGSTAAGQNTTYNFGGAGNFDVQLSASKNGCLETHNQLLSVNPAPTASFIYSLVSLDDPVQFIDNSTLNGGPPIVEWSWNFGDPMSGLDNFSDLQNPVHLFSALGNYDVNLTVTDENGCSDDTTITLTVNPRPVAGFYWELPCFGTDVQFVDTSTTSQGFITDWFWNFGDPASGAFNESTAQNPTHSFTAPGIYNVQLVVKAFGYDTIVQQVEIFAPPTADFSFNTPCQGEAVNFIDESLPGDAPIESWFWDFADGNTSDEQNPSHVYQFSGNYLVDLTVTDTNGCSATITKNVTIWQGPTAQFNTFSACVGNLTFFIDKSTADGADIIQWDWNFGDPASGGDNFSTEQNPSHEYTAEGVYEVILIVEDANGCVDSDTVDLVVEPAPVADFIADSVCLGNVMTFINQSFSNGQPISNYYWEFGDGSTSTDANPTKTYSEPGNYDVLLVVETEGGCSAEVVKTVKVFFLPVADFEWTNNQACEMDTTFFTDFSAPVGNAIIDTWFWQFGDGGTSDERNPAHYYADAGSYAVNLLVTDINGCQNSITKTVVVSEAPVSNFIFNTSDCNTLNFTSTGFDPNGLDITAWYWDFGDPASGGDNTSIDANPSHTYVNGGTYNVLHIVFNENGCRDTIVQQVLISGPEAAFSFENNCSGLPVNFFDESNTNGNDPAVAWLWDFNDGSPNSIQQNPTHVFDLGGSYLVSLTITTVNGCVSQTAELVEVEFGPTANFTFTSLSCSGDSIQFTDASTGDAGIDTWNWQMGDGTQFDIPNPKHAYAVAGTYLVKLRVTDANGCYNDKSVNLEIDQSPTANFNWETRNCDTTFFSDFSNPNGTTINAWTWQFDDPASGAENISFLQNPFHKFTATGAYNVQLTVSNTFLCSDTLTRLVEYQAQPEPDFTFDTVCFGDATSFSDLTPTDFQDIQAWIWDFGDNSALSFEQNPEHVYNAPGTYFAKLKVINGTFCEDSIVKQVLVRELPLVAFSPDSSCFASPITFTDESIYNGTPNSWLWNFGDGTSATEESPIHTYAAAGTYNVSLTVNESVEGVAAGCSNTLTKAHFVNALPAVDFEYQAACAGSVTQFTSLASSAVGIDSWQWDFGDGSSGSNAANPNHTFSLPGLYPVKLIVTDFLGCVDSITKVVEAFEIPIVAFDAPAVCLGDSMFFTDLTLPQADSWSWSFGDGGTSTDQNPKHLYQNAGTYSVLLQASTPGGCSSSVVQQVEVYPLPIVDFAWNFAACAGSEVQFEDLSQGISGDVTGWEWDFGDGSPVSNDQNPVHIFQTGDVAYNVQLVVVTETGCTDTLVQEVGITGAPLAEFSISNGAGEGPCVNNTFSFEDLSTTQSGIIQDWEWDFGDGNGSGSKDPFHNYDEADTYTVRLIVTNTAGCVDTATQELDVFALPIVEFSFDSVCFGDTTQFIDSDFINVGAIDLWQYNFGDGSPPSDESDPKHLFTGPGDYTVILQLTDTNLCVNQKDSIVPVYGLPLVNFTFDTACLFEATNFSDLSIPADHDLDQWTWNFGDGNSVTGISNPSHTYDDFGNYTTKLIVTDSWGCVDSTQKLVNVYEPPVAQFSWSDTSCTAGKIYFFDESFHNQGWAITQRLWDINNFESDLAEPVYIFPDVETTYPVSLIATDQRGCSDTLTEDVFVPAELSIDFTADTVCFGDSTMLIASALLPANAQVGTWVWFFDDGSPQLSTTEDTVYHSFASDGVFRVELTALELATNCNATIRKDVLVRKLPTAAFLAAAAACADSTEFIDQSALGDGPISNWTWYFGDGNSESITAPDPADTKYLYPPFLDTFEASLAITDVFGCEDSIAQEVLRFPCLFVNFTTDTNIYCQDKAVTLIDSSIVQSNAVVLQKYWNFGDGTELITDPDIDTVTHIYEQTGIYEIAFAIRFEINGDILSDTIRKSIEVYPTPIVAIAAENVCDGEEALLVSNTDANNSIVDNWTWFFGDGEQINIISDDVNNAVYHTYPQSGSYDLMLMAVTDLGCRDTASKAFVVNPVPQVVITADTTEICGPGTILFTDASTLESGSIIRRGWSFGDFTDAIVTEDTISHFYDMGSTSSSGSRYTVTLTAVSDSSCSATDSIVNMISQYSLPRPAFTVEPDSIAITEVEELMLFNDSENAFYFDWVLSDTLRYEDSYEPNIWQDIQDTGTYNLQLLAQTVDGCWDSTESQFKVYPIFRFFIPNAFSPNGNGVNETFGPKGRYFDDKTFKMQIFSRWGELVFETEDFFEQWDGRNKNGGKMQPIGVYAWVIEVVDLQGNIKTFKGAVTLVL
jgi:gliding motility-associated-like protein